MLNPTNCILYSGGATGAEEKSGQLAEQYGVQEVNFSFAGHKISRLNGLRILTSEELAKKDVSLTYVSRLMNRSFSEAPIFRKILQSICWQVTSGAQIFIIGTIEKDNTVHGGTGWGAEFAKICNKPLYVFEQNEKVWMHWVKTKWELISAPQITDTHFTCSGTRFLTPAGSQALEQLFIDSFE